jgi:cytochrome P450
MPTAEVSVDSLFALDPATVRCPYAQYADLRTHQPVRWVEQLGAYMVTRYSDVIAILGATDEFSNALASGPGSVTGLAHKLFADPDTPATLRTQAQRRIELSKSPVLLNSDPPLHIRQRKLVNKAFTARRVLEMETSVTEIANGLVDEFVGDGRVELVSQFSIRLPMTVIAGLLGVPAQMHPVFKRWSDAFVAGVGSVTLTQERITDLFAAVDEFYDYFTVQIEARETEPGDDLVSAIVHARLDGETPLTRNEMLQMLVQFLVAGNETTTNLITSIMFTLLGDPALMALVRADHGQIPAVVEEALRLESPVQGTFRTALRDTRIDGVDIAQGSALYLVLGSANRDEGAFPEAAQTDLTRRGNHLAFGKGEHFCLGASIARLEARIAIDTLLSRLDDIELDCEPTEVAYLPSFAHHGISGLPLTFSAR